MFSFKAASCALVTVLLLGACASAPDSSSPAADEMEMSSVAPPRAINTMAGVQEKKCVGGPYSTYVEFLNACLTKAEKAQDVAAFCSEGGFIGGEVTMSDCEPIAASVPQTYYEHLTYTCNRAAPCLQ